MWSRLWGLGPIGLSAAVCSDGMRLFVWCRISPRSCLRTSCLTWATSLGWCPLRRHPFHIFGRRWRCIWRRLPPRCGRRCCSVWRNSSLRSSRRVSCLEHRLTVLWIWTLLFIRAPPLLRAAHILSPHTIRPSCNGRRTFYSMRALFVIAFQPLRRRSCSLLRRMANCVCVLTTASSMRRL